MAIILPQLKVAMGAAGNTEVASLNEVMSRMNYVCLVFILSCRQMKPRKDKICYEGIDG